MLGLFLAVLALFHLSEFAFSAVYTRHELGWHSFLVSKPYAAAMLFAACEYLVEQRLCPGLKTSVAAARAQHVGLVCVILGETLRKAGQLTAKQCFTHNISTRRREDHVLVTTGVYRYVRHPGYLGWLIWAVGTQVMLANPVSIALFAYTSWRFFAARIAFEEAALRRFFGAAYDAYAARTRTWIVGIP